MIESLSGRTPEKAPRWDLTGTEGCGSGKVFFVALLIGFGIVENIYTEEIGRWRHEGPTRVGARPTTLGVPPDLVAASWLS